jgi:hypothetical protein
LGLFITFLNHHKKGTKAERGKIEEITKSGSKAYIQGNATRKLPV